jgi:hypothetical protein
MPHLNNANVPWTALDDAMLRKLARENTPTRIIAMKLGRTAFAIYARARLLGLSLRPVNQSPFNKQEA